MSTLRMVVSPPPYGPGSLPWIAICQNGLTLGGQTSESVTIHLRLGQWKQVMEEPLTTLLDDSVLWVLQAGKLLAGVLTSSKARTSCSAVTESDLLPP